MSIANPIIASGISATSGIILTRAVINLGLALRWWNKDDALAWSDFMETVLPILFVWAGAYYASKHMTPLDKPRDADGTPLTRPDNAPAIRELEGLQNEAIKINDEKTKEVTRGLT